MIIEVTGIGYPNKGAELMLEAVVDRVRKQYGTNVVITTAPTAGSDLGYRTLSALGLHQTAHLFWKGFDLGTPLGNLLPEKLLRTFGCVPEKNINCVLDASGLRYSDRWGVKTFERALRQYRRTKKRGGKIVLLPQAFGPFEKPSTAQLMQDLIDTVDLVFARDKVSKGWIDQVAGESDKVRISPDFTGLLKGVEAAELNQFHGKICLIPNSRMLDKTSPDVSRSYVLFLVKLTEIIKKKGHDVFILNHEGSSDHAICVEIANRFDPPLGYTGNRSAREIKFIIGKSAGVFTSRFHGLVSSLNQGIPAIATSWNHKYEELYNSFSVPLSILDSSADIDGQKNMIHDWLHEVLDSEHPIRSQLLKRGEELKDDSELMWQEVFRVIDPELAS